LSSMNITRNNFQFVPHQNFENNWSDEKLFKLYDLDNEEIKYINSLIKEM